MAFNQLKLKDAMKKGFVPPELKAMMDANNHIADIKVIEGLDQERTGVHYEVEGTSYTHWYTAEEIDEMLKNE